MAKHNLRGWGAATGGSSKLLKGPEDYFAMGDWNARCDECYRKCKASSMFLRWDNCRVCWRCMEIRNPQDFVQGIPDYMTAPWTRQTPPQKFATSTDTPEQTSGQSTMINGNMINGVMIG